jgi:hypothetical protein
MARAGVVLLALLLLVPSVTLHAVGQGWGRET